MPKNNPLKLLVVDDHAEFRRTMRQTFADHDVSIIEAASGEEAVRLFGTERPDWVLMDLRMTGMGGLKATEAIRKLDPQARVIIISQFNELEHRHQALRAGAVDFVDKQDVAQLAERICGPIPQS